MLAADQNSCADRLSSPITITMIKKDNFGLKLNLLELDFLVGVGEKTYSDLGHLENEIYKTSVATRP
jgi:hypothetical protein